MQEEGNADEHRLRSSFFIKKDRSDDEYCRDGHHQEEGRAEPEIKHERWFDEVPDTCNIEHICALVLVHIFGKREEKQEDTTDKGKRKVKGLDTLDHRILYLERN